MPAATKKYTIQSKQSDGSMTTMYPETDGTVVHYDNSTSGLTASNAQAAIDELKTLTDNGTYFVTLQQPEAPNDTSWSITAEEAQKIHSDSCIGILLKYNASTSVDIGMSEAFLSVISSTITITVAQQINHVFEAGYRVMITSSLYITNTDVSFVTDMLLFSDIANETLAGFVKPVVKTTEMTQSVGVDNDGALWTKPSEKTSEIATSGQSTPSSDLIVGGLFFTDV